MPVVQTTHVTQPTAHAPNSRDLCLSTPVAPLNPPISDPAPIMLWRGASATLFCRSLARRRLPARNLGGGGRIAPCACCYSNVPSRDDTRLTSKRPRDRSRLADACRRLFSSESGPPSNKLPPLMSFPQIIWPSIVKSVRNFILTTFIIKPYMDREFNIPDFVVGSKKAVEVRGGARLRRF